LRPGLGGLVALSLALLASPTVVGASCRDTAGVGGEGRVRWEGPSDPIDETALGLWCRAVGGALLTAPVAPPASAAPTDGLAVVVWNLHVGHGDVERLLGELRAGELTDGQPVEHFVLLLQEAVRVGEAVPTFGLDGAISASAIGSPVDASRSIEALAARTGLFGFYAPSMRNGAAHREDRGNAILSTLPLLDPAALELPWERQRRVVVAATVALPTAEGGARPLRVVSAHFDNSSRLTRFWRSFGAGRLRQAHALVGWLDGDDAVILGGDFNTWWDGSEEDAVKLLRKRFPLPGVLPLDVTYQPPYGMPQRQADYMLLRLPAGWQADYHVNPDWGGSDHAPLIGWLEVEARDVAASREEE
jgi:endonuclease/exonuclease/phosphatase family metal-dependent hydrolase